MIDKLSFRYKMLIVPALAVIGFCVVFLVTVMLGIRSSGKLREVQTGYYPSVEMSQDLNDDLAGIQRGLQDAVAAKNVEALSETDALRDKFIQRLGDGKDNPLLEHAELEQLQSDMNNYYKVARQTTENMITGSGSSDLVASLATMRDKYNAIREKLQANKKRDKDAITKAFDDTRSAQSRALTFIAVTILICLVPMIGLSWRLTRAVTRPLLEAVRVAGCPYLRKDEHGSGRDRPNA